MIPDPATRGRDLKLLKCCGNMRKRKMTLEGINGDLTAFRKTLQAEEAN